MINPSDKRSRHAITLTQGMINVVLEPVWDKLTRHMFYHENSRPDGGYFTSILSINSDVLNINDKYTQLSIAVDRNGIIGICLIGRMHEHGDLPGSPAHSLKWEFPLSDPECIDKVQGTLRKLVEGEDPHE